MTPPWPTTFVTGVFKGSSKSEALAEAINGAALARLLPAPKNFAAGMVDISRYLGVTLTPKTLDSLADVYNRVGPEVFNALYIKEALFDQLRLERELKKAGTLNQTVTNTALDA